MPADRTSPSSSRTPGLAALLLVVAACGGDAPPWADHRGARPPAHGPRAAAAPAVLVTVDGTAITSADLDAAVAAAARAESPHQGPTSAAPTSAPDRKATLEALIDQELAARRAEALGLDADADYQEERGRLLAQLASFRRQRLSRLLERQVAAAAVVTDAEARAFFDANADRIRTQVRVNQILLHDQAAITELAAQLAAGAPFAEVATRTLPAPPPPGATPWDLGYLAWNQVPEPWEPVLATLAVGATSGIIEGPRGRRWIIQLVDRRVDPAITFATARPAILLLLRTRAGAAAVTALAGQLRAGATIERSR